jgi:hypothetical protein
MKHRVVIAIILLTLILFQTVIVRAVENSGKRAQQTAGSAHKTLHDGVSTINQSGKDLTKNFQQANKSIRHIDQK